MEVETNHRCTQALDASSTSGATEREHRLTDLHVPRLDFGFADCSLSSADSLACHPTTGAEVVAAHAGDHALIHTLLRAAHQQPTLQDFLSWLDEPTYSPSDRLLVRENDQIVAHVQMLRRWAMFEQVRVPCADLQDLAVLPELAPLGYDRWLLEVAEHALLESRAVISVLRTDRREPYLATGWSEARGRGYSRASVGDLLAHLVLPPAARKRRRRGLHIRLWRHVELDALQAIYRRAVERLWGAVNRSERYWQWLVGRTAHSELIVAVDGADDWDDFNHAPHIVGYAVTHGPQVIELCCLPGYERAAPRLLERACQDAIERDYHSLSLHTSATDPLHELMVTSGGNWCTDERGAGGTLLVKLLDPIRWIEALDPLLRRRTKAAGIPRPCEITFAVADARYRLQLTRRSSRLIAEDSTSFDVQCAPQTFSDLLVGNLHVGRAVEDGRLSVHGETIMRALAALFPASIFWQSHFDTLR